MSESEQTPPIRSAQPSQAVLMCGGLGTRLRPWSYVIPKPLFPLGERPILELLIERLAAHGITDILLSVGYMAEMIEWKLGDGHQLGVQVRYFREAQPLGTAGALNLMREHLTTPFFMMNGDLVTRLDFGQMYAHHLAQGAWLTVGTKPYEVQIPYGVVDSTAGRVTGLREKPTHRMDINAGIYVISPPALTLLPPQGHYDATQLIQAVLKAGQLAGSYAIQEYWLDIGQVEDYERAQADARQWEAHNHHD